jgi:hypothetical protein
MNPKMPHNDFRGRMKPPQACVVVLAALMAAAFAAVAQETNLSSALDYPAFKIIVERNIFNQNRTAHDRASGRSATRVPDSFSLVGTLFYAGGDIAFFDGSSADYRRALKVDGEVAGFKVTAITLNSVTLSDGTNQTVLKITTQMRRDDDGHWSVSTEPASYSSAGSSSGSIPGKPYSSRINSARATGAAAGNGKGDNLSPAWTEEPPTPEMEGNTSDASVPPGRANANDALARLMQRRAQQEQQLGQGQ